MTTEKELILKLQALKQIKPNTEWVSLTKKQIFQAPSVMPGQATFANFSGMFFQKRLAYAFAVLLVAVVGVTGVVKYSIPGAITQELPASLALQSDIRNSIESFNQKSQELASASTNKDITSAVQGVKDASKTLAEAVRKNSSIAKEVAIQIKASETLLSVVGNNDLKQTSQNLYITIAQQMIQDLQKTSLSKDQQHSLDDAMVLYQEGKYSEVLEKLLLIGGAE